MTVTIRVLLGLVGGFLLGLGLAGIPSPAATMTIGILGLGGTIFINLIRMTVIPLVVSMLVASVGSLATSGALGRAGMRALILASALLTAAAIVTVLIAAPALARIHIDQEAALALRGPAAAPPSAAAPSSRSTLAQWFLSLERQKLAYR